MGRKAKDTTITVEEGLYLKPVHGRYQCYFRFEGRQFRRSTKTSDYASAKAFALEWFREIQTRKKEGIAIKAVAFAQLKRDYLLSIKNLGKHGYHAATIERHFLPFFANVDDVSKLSRASVTQYLSFRRAQGERAPTPQTINRENTVLRQLLKFAVDNEWMKSAPTIPNISEKLTRRRRRHFTSRELRQLCLTAFRRAKALDGNPLQTRQSWQRKLLFDFICLMVHTGLRVDEAKSIIWRNVDFGSSTLLLEHAGKTRSNRRVLLRRGALKALHRLHDRRRQYLEARGLGFNQSEAIISLPNGKRISSMKKGYAELLKACGFAATSHFDRYTLTSLRHTYATIRLTTRLGKRSSLQALSKQMGTSVRMIVRHYGHDEIEDYRNELLG